MHAKKILTLRRLEDDVTRVSHDNDHFLSMERARFAVHRIVCFGEPDATFSARVQFAQITATNCPVEGLVYVYIGTCENSCNALKHATKQKVASLLERLDCSLITA